MATVNYYMVNSLLGPLGGDNDEDYIKYKAVDPNDANQVKQIISATILPYYNGRTDAYQISAKRSLSYFLTTDRLNFGRLYNSCLMPLEHPDDPKLFFIWIWEVLFPDEKFEMTNFSEMTEIEDTDEPRGYFSDFLK